jgi:hypothetical protein
VEHELYSINVIFGSVEPRTFNKFEDGKMVTYSYAIHRDRDGVETHRTAPEKLSSIGWHDDTPFTKTDYEKLKGGSCGA